MNDTLPTSGELARVQTVADLAECLRRLRRVRGNDSLRAIEESGIHQGRPMPKTTLGDGLSGKVVWNPDFMSNFLASQGVREESEVRPWLEALTRARATLPAVNRRGVVDRGVGPAPAHRFFVETDEVDQIYKMIEGVLEQVWLLGTTLSMHVSYLRAALRNAIINGRSVRILLIVPAGAAMEMAALRAGPDGMSLEAQQEQLCTNLKILREIASVGSGLEVKLIDYLAPYTLYAYDPGLDSGKMVMRLGSFHGKHHLRPTFEVERRHDEDWFPYFYEQFVSIWNAADTYDLRGNKPCHPGCRRCLAEIDAGVAA